MSGILNTLLVEHANGRDREEILRELRTALAEFFVFTHDRREDLDSEEDARLEAKRLRNRIEYVILEDGVRRQEVLAALAGAFEAGLR